MPGASNATFDVGIFDENIFDTSRWIPSSGPENDVWLAQTEATPIWGSEGATASIWTPINPTS